MVDRVIQQAILQVLTPRYDPTFSSSSYGFRPNKSAHQALAAGQEHVANGKAWVVDLDLETFFDRVNHDILLGRLAKRIGDPRVRRVIRRYLEAGVLADGVVIDRHEGTPQGGPVTPPTIWQTPLFRAWHTRARRHAEDDADVGEVDLDARPDGADLGVGAGPLSAKAGGVRAQATVVRRAARLAMRLSAADRLAVESVATPGAADQAVQEIPSPPLALPRMLAILGQVLLDGRSPRGQAILRRLRTTPSFGKLRTTVRGVSHAAPARADGRMA